MIHAALGAAAGRLLDAEGRWVRGNFALTADGAVEVDGRSGGIGGDDDRRIFSTLRAGADVVLVGSGTVRAEQYGAVRIDDAALEWRATHGRGTAVPVAVVTSRADLLPDAKLFRESAAPGRARALVMTCEAAPAQARRALEDVAEVVVCGDGAVDDGLVVDELDARGLSRVLCEGGPTILRRLVGAGLVDELCLTIGPLLAGPGHAGLLGDDPLPGALRMRLVGLLSSDDGALFARYRLDDPHDRSSDDR